MIEGYQLVAIVKEGARFGVYRVPLKQELQSSFATLWAGYITDFTEDCEFIPFDPGYQPEDEERFQIEGFELPDWLILHSQETVAELPMVSDNSDKLGNVKALAAFGNLDGRQIIAFQSFSKSHVVQPGRALFLKNGIYTSSDNAVLAIGNNCSAVYYRAEEKLIFSQFRAVNVYLPLSEYYREAAESDIRAILSHPSFKPENADKLAVDASAWFRKRFALLKDSGVLDSYSVDHIVQHSRGYDLELRVDDGQIVFPEDKAQAKKLLQYLNEELYRGAITEQLYETNSKRVTD